MIFGRCPEGLFESALELGAGDGFQSGLLRRWARRVVATDYDASGLPAAAPEGIVFQACDAERAGESFPAGSFDLVFSSNLLEHLPDPVRALEGTRSILRDDGVAVHVLPSPLWKIAHLALHVPNRAVLALERLAEPGGAARAVARLSGRTETRRLAEGERPLGNNPKTDRRGAPLLVRLLVPRPHAVSRGNLQELIAFRRSRWRRDLERAGFEVVAEGKGPLASGYGFGFDRTRRLLEALGLSSERYFVGVKRGAASPHAVHFPGGRAGRRV